MHMIEVEHLTKDYGSGRGVFDVSISVDKGEVFGFLGPNGAGKSTTIRHLMGFSKPDSGSMAYVLSTSTKRSTVVFTQAAYLVGSLLAMFGITTATGCVCLAVIDKEVSLTYGNLVLLNLGAFLVLFALSGLCFFTSCYFDRSKRSMAIGGGLSIFALVAAMLGLFGSPVIPSVVRLDSLNYFNYATIISLFDVISIMDGTVTFVWKFAILLGLGIVGYVAGSLKFVKKDLPL